jgi:hypothetical protein
MPSAPAGRMRGNMHCKKEVFWGWEQNMNIYIYSLQA